MGMQQGSRYHPTDNASCRELASLSQQRSPAETHTSCRRAKRARNGGGLERRKKLPLSSTIWCRGRLYWRAAPKGARGGKAALATTHAAPQSRVPVVPSAHSFD